MTYRLWQRLALGYLAALSLLVGAWAAVAPRSFYDDFPGLGMVWVAVDGPYNEHLTRDVGGLNLALAVVLIAAVVTLSRPLVLSAAAAAIAYGLPHLIYHVFNPRGLGAADLALSLGGLALFVALPVAIVVVDAWSSRREQRQETVRSPVA